MKFKGLSIKETACNFFKANILPCLNNQLNFRCALIFCDVDFTGIILLSIYSNYFISPVLTTVTKEESLFSCICVAYCYHKLADQYLQHLKQAFLCIIQSFVSIQQWACLHPFIHDTNDGRQKVTPVVSYSEVLGRKFI